MNEQFFENYVPRLDDRELDFLGDYYEKRELQQRGVTFIAFIFLYEKGLWLW